MKKRILLLFMIVFAVLCVTVPVAAASATPQYTITWKDGNGKVLKTQKVKKNVVPKYTGTTPTKKTTNTAVYKWNGRWSPSVTKATKNVTYTAQFSSTPRYKMTWKDGNGKVIKTTYVTKGSVPTYSGTAPTKKTTNSYAYSWNKKWSPTPGKATRNMTFTAQFAATPRYAITWKDGNGKVLKITYVTKNQTPSYSGTTPTKNATSYYSYVWNKKWSPSVVKATRNATYTAQFTSTARTYTITWKNWDGKVLKTDKLGYGKTPSYSGSTPVKAAASTESYAFTGWSPAIKAVSGNATYTATFKSIAKRYTITWKDGNGSTLKTETVAAGTKPAYSGATPTKKATATETYTFAGWSPAITAASANATYTAQFTAKPIQYTITWKNWDGSVLRTDKVDAGTTPKYTGSTPMRPRDAEYRYEFTGWSPVGTSVTANVTYIAQYRAIHDHVHTWEDCTETIHHDEEGHYETVVIQEAGEYPVYEEVPVYESKCYSKCSKCGLSFKNLSSEEAFFHVLDCNSSYMDYWEDVQVGTELIDTGITEWRDAIVEDQWVVDVAAWDEMITYKRCSVCYMRY